MTQAFLDLRTTGIAPTAEMLNSFGDIASSRGKGIRDFTQAVQDALTGEMERLKEFGIVAKQQGDRVSFTFNGQTTEVKRTRGAILEYLQSVGQLDGVQGSMSEKMVNLNGLFSNLWDNLGKIARTAGEEGAAGEMGDLLKRAVDFTGALSENRAEIRYWTGALAAGARFVGSTVSSTFRVVIAGVTILIGTLLAHLLTAQRAALVTLNTVKSSVNSVLDGFARIPGVGRLVPAGRLEMSDLEANSRRFEAVTGAMGAAARDLAGAFDDTAEAWARMAVAFDRNNQSAFTPSRSGSFGDGSVVGAGTAIGGGAGASGGGGGRVRNPQASASTYGMSPYPVGDLLGIPGGRAPEEMVSVFDQIRALAKDTATAISDSFTEAFALIWEEGTTSGDVLKAVFVGIGRAATDALGEWARGKSRQNFIQSLEDLADALKAQFTPGLQWMAPGLFRAAAQHAAVGVAWGALAGAGVGASRAIGGGGGGGGAYRDRRDHGSSIAEGASRPGPEVHLYGDFDMLNVRTQEGIYGAYQYARKRFGDDARIIRHR